MVNNYSQFFSDQPLVKTFSEFQPLEEVIVGTPYHADTFDSSDKFSQEAKDLLKWESDKDLFDMCADSLRWQQNYIKV